MPTVYLAYGSNMGDRYANIRLAQKLLNQNGIKIIEISKPIPTKPLGGIPQADFLNGVFAARTQKTPDELLKTIKTIEERMGRVKHLKNGPRPIDLDILLYDDLKIKTDKLQIPHPEIAKRAFVREPLKKLQNAQLRTRVRNSEFYP